MSAPARKRVALAIGGESSGLRKSSSRDDSSVYRESSVYGESSSRGESSVYGGFSGYGVSSSRGESSSHGESSVYGGFNGFGESSVCGGYSGYGVSSSRGKSSSRGESSVYDGFSGYGVSSSRGESSSHGEFSVYGGFNGFGESSVCGGYSGYGVSSSRGKSSSRGESSVYGGYSGYSESSGYGESSASRGRGKWNASRGRGKWSVSRGRGKSSVSHDPSESCARCRGEPSYKKPDEDSIIVISSSSSECSDSDVNNLIGMTDNIDFEGRSLKYSDFDSIIQFLQKLFLKAPIDLYYMTWALIRQPKIGTVIQEVCDITDDKDIDVNQIFGIVSILNITQLTNECVTNIQKLVLDLSEQHGDYDTKQFLKKLLKNDKIQVGLLINERFCNMSSTVSVPLFQALRKDLSDLKTNNPSYDFDYLIMICSIMYKVENDEKGNKYLDDKKIIWSKSEEQTFNIVAEYKFEYCVQNENYTYLDGNWVEPNDPNMISFRRVLIISMKNFYKIIKVLEYLLPPDRVIYKNAYYPDDVHED